MHNDSSQTGKQSHNPQRESLQALQTVAQETLLAIDKAKAAAPQPSHLQSESENATVSNPRTAEQTRIEELVVFISQEVATWARLQKKSEEHYSEDLVLILDELVRSGYTVREALTSGLRERLRRHRWDLQIGVFYPDDKLLDSELRQALARSYARGKREGQALAQTPTEKVSSEEVKHFVAMEALQHENEVLKMRILKLEYECNPYSNVPPSQIPK